jgi:hypothetical protein
VIQSVDKGEIYGEITAAFKHKFGELGLQFAEELLTSIASANIQHTFLEQLGHERIRSHVLLYWQQGWLKSSLLMKARDIIGEASVELISDISKAALRGTVEYDADNEPQFNPPKVLRAPFIIATELGTLTGKGLSGGEDLNQILLQILEEGIVNVDLSKFVKLTEEYREFLRKQYPTLKFKGSTGIEYKTDCVWLGATYNSKYVVDSAFSTRWEIMIPKVELNSELTKYVDRHRWLLPQDINAKVQHLLHREAEQKYFDLWYEDLPDAVYDVNPNISPRFARAVKVFKLCNRMYWDFDASKKELVERMRHVIHSQARSRQSTKEDIQDFLKKIGKAVPFETIKEALGIDGMTLARDLEAFPKMKDEEGGYVYVARRI